MKTTQLYFGKRSQAFVIDFLLAAFIMIVLMIFLMGSYDKNTVRYHEETEYTELATLGYQISDLLVSYPGKPSNWDANISDLDVLGLASSDRILSKRKVDSFFNLSYNSVKELLNIEYYDFQLTIRNMTGDNMTGIFGQSNSTKRTITYQRYVMYDGKNATLEFTVWK